MNDSDASQRAREDGSITRRARVAWTLSFWCPGLGQLYAAAWLRGAVILLVSAGVSQLALDELPLSAIWACDWPADPLRVGLLWGTAIAVWLWNLGDATRVARLAR